MEAKDNPSRNRPADEGRRNDPDLRDESAAQPGVNTLSSSDYDDNNQKLTETAAHNFRPDSPEDRQADPDFEDINGDDGDDEEEDEDDEDDNDL